MRHSRNKLSVNRVKALRSGLGFGLMPQSLVETDLKQGKLEAVFPHRLETGGAYWLVGTEASIKRKRVRLFVDWVRKQNSAVLPA